MEEEDITLETLPDELELGLADGGEAVSNVSESISLKELKEVLGKDFKDKESALKSVKDTYRFVGKPKETPKVDESKFISKEQYEQDMFYSKNGSFDKPEFRSIIDSIAKAKGISHRDVVELPEFKSIHEKVKGYDENQGLKTVLSTNPRLVASKDKLTQANEALRAGKKENAENLAVNAVMEAFDL
jgi:hypothetical protein